MIILCRDDLTPEQRDRIRTTVGGLGSRWWEREEGGRAVFETAPEADAMRCEVERLAGVERVFAGEPGAHLATRDHRSAPTQVRVGGAVFGAGRPVVIAGPCAGGEKRGV